MTLTKKEQGLLKDLQNEEKLCVEKYRKAAENACDAKLQHIFEKIEKAEQSHYDTVTGMLAGTLPAQQGQQSKGQASRQKAEKDLKSTASRDRVVTPLIAAISTGIIPFPWSPLLLRWMVRSSWPVT